MFVLLTTLPPHHSQTVPDLKPVGSHQMSVKLPKLPIFNVASKFHIAEFGIQDVFLHFSSLSLLINCPDSRFVFQISNILVLIPYKFAKILDNLFRSSDILFTHQILLLGLQIYVRYLDIIVCILDIPL